MSIVVGYLPTKGGRACLDLAAVVARSGVSESVEVVTVGPRHWATPSMAKVDAEFAAWAHQLGEQSLAEAQDYLARKWPDVDASFHRTEGRSVSSALNRAAADFGADMLILGSSAQGRVGQVVIGSTAEPLLHSSPIPVAIAPRGYRAPAGATAGRLTCSFLGTDDGTDLLTATAQMGVRVGAALRIVTFAVRGRTMYPPEVGLHAEDLVLQQFKEQVRVDQQAAVAHLAAVGLPTNSTVTDIATGSTWDEAMDELDWEPGEILVVGSSRGGRLRRVFLGSSAIKILRHAPVPVVVVPSDVAAEIADEVTEVADDGVDPVAQP